MNQDRRTILTGAAALTAQGWAATPAWATTTTPDPKPEKVFTSGILARNMLANEFEMPPGGLVWPERLKLAGPEGAPASLADYRGKTLVVNLWAEWCTPCLTEMEGFAIMDKKVRTDTFQIITILTASNYRKVEDAAPLMKKLKSENLPVLLDASPNRSLAMRRLSRSREDPGGALPCTLLVDAAGVLRGRMMGSTLIPSITAAKDGKAGKTGQHNIWTTTIALQFVQALSDGALSA